MKRNYFSFIAVALTAAALTLASCQKEDLLTELSEAAKPEGTKQIDNHGARGAWVGKKSISTPIPPVPPL